MDIGTIKKQASQLYVTNEPVTKLGSQE